MAAIYRQHLTALANLGPVACFVLLRDLARWGVGSEAALSRSLSPRGVARQLGIPIRTVYRHWGRTMAPYQPAEYGHAHTWAVPKGRRGRNPWYLRIEAEGVRALLSLAKLGRLGWPALRLALHLWPKLRGASSAGANAITVRLPEVAQTLGMSHRTILDALAQMTALGLVKRSGSARTRLDSRGGYLGQRPSKPSNKAGCHSGTGASFLKTPSGSVCTHTREARAKGASGPVPSRSQSAEVFRLVRRHLGGRGNKATVIAKMAQTPERFLAWFDQEADNLADARSPFGKFWWLATQCGSRPGKLADLGLDCPRQSALELAGLVSQEQTAAEPSPATTADPFEPLRSAVSEAQTWAGQAGERAGEAEVAAIGIRGGSDSCWSALQEAARETAYWARHAAKWSETASGLAEEIAEPRAFDLANQANLAAECAAEYAQRAAGLETEHRPTPAAAGKGRHPGAERVRSAKASALFARFRHGGRSEDQETGGGKAQGGAQDRGRHLPRGPAGDPRNLQSLGRGYRAASPSGGQEGGQVDAPAPRP